MNSSSEREHEHQQRTRTRTPTENANANFDGRVEKGGVEGVGSMLEVDTKSGSN